MDDAYGYEHFSLGDEEGSNGASRMEAVSERGGGVGSADADVSIANGVHGE